MGMVAPSNEKRVLADELAQARALIEDGEQEAALDRLATASEIAREQGDAAALRAIRGLSWTVWRKAPSTPERADWPMRVWTLIVVVGWLAVSVILAFGLSEGGFLSLSGIRAGWLILALLLGFSLPAIVVWLLGVLIMWLPRRHPTRVV